MRFPKAPEHRSEAWRKAVAALPCVVCMREGMTQAAHLNHRGKGMALKAPDCYTIPMCVECHREFDAGTRWTRNEKRELGDEWLIQTVLTLASTGAIRA